MYADGSGLTNLTNSPNFPESEPAWSPDGSTIAFRYFNGTSNVIATMPSTGGNPTPITQPPAPRHDTQPDWSPDGTRIVFTRSPGATGTTAAIYVVGAAGGTPVELATADFGLGHASWSPSGTRIAFELRSRIWTMNADGSGQSQIGPASSQGPDWGSAETFAAATASQCGKAAGGLPRASKPRAGRDVSVDVVRGSVRVKPRGSGEFVPLEDASQLPVGSTVDATDGTVRLTAAANLRGATMRGDFDGGQFKIKQARRRRPVMQLVLTGGDASVCGTGSRRARSAGRSIRRLRGNARGRFRTRGGRSSATVRGTRWVTEDRCDGTLTSVQSGRVVVRDFARRRNVTLRRGDRYLARARRRG